MKMSVIYHSVTGNTKRMGDCIVSGMNSVEGAEARSFPIDAIDEDFAKDSKCIIFGSPIYTAHITGQMVDFFLNGARKLQLAGKLTGAYTTAQDFHGGGDLGIRDMLDYCMTMGALVYSGGSAEGKPVIHLGPVGIDNTMDIEQFVPYFEAYGRRMAQMALKLFEE